LNPLEPLEDQTATVPARLRFALVHAARMSRAISDISRRTRFSTRVHRIGYAGGFRARRGEQLFRAAIFASFILMVVVPSIVAIAYFGFIASPQYISEAELTLGGAETPAFGDGAAYRGVPVATVIQDTQVMAKFLQSRAMVEELSRTTDIRSIYANSKIDWLARLRPDASMEDLRRYWKFMTAADVKMPGGIITFSVRAYSPEAAATLATAALAISEKMINDLNRRMLQDTVGRATEGLKDAGDRLATARAKLEQARNQEGMLDASKAADSINDLLTSVTAGRIAVQQEYDSRLRFVTPDQPEMRRMRAQLRAANSQIADLKSQLTVTGQTGQNPVVAAAMVKLDQLELDRSIGEQQYSQAATALESARVAAESKLVYVNSFVMPAPGRSLRFPTPGEAIAISIVGALLLWALLATAATLVRNNMA
jgi:capsular polysaccharide transport system permease protein